MSYKILKVYNGYTNWEPLSNIIDDLFNGENIAKLASAANLWRNELAHNKREYMPTIDAIKAIRLVEHLNYTMVLRYADYNDNQIKAILTELLIR